LLEINLALALTAGILATFNPCGFALLPAYLTSIILTKEEPGAAATAPYFRAMRFAIAFSLGLLVIFAAVGLLVFPISYAVQEYLPFVTGFMGLVLIVLGALLLWGKSPIMAKFLNPNIAPGRSFMTQFGYGVTYALASLSCTIGPFLAITTGAIQQQSLLQLLAVFSSYSLGMAATVFVLAAITAAAKQTVLKRIRQAYPIIEKGTALLLILVGSYFLLYAWYELQLYQGLNFENPVIEAVTRLQGQVASFVGTTGPWPFLVVALGILITVLFLKRRKHKTPLG
jgi:cytochrome c biogenesis protein CcdA